MNLNSIIQFDIGRQRTHQEDNGIILRDIKCSDLNHKSSAHIIIVADGMGGAANGAQASKLCIEALTQYFFSHKFDVNAINDYLLAAVQFANSCILSYASRHEQDKGMGSTVVLSLFFEGNIYVMWVGDSRFYKYNNKDGLVLITKDHSYVQDLIDQHILDPKDEFDHPNKNIINQSLGSSSIKPSSAVLPLTDDLYLMCSDGLNTMLRHNEIENILSTSTNLESTVATLINEANNKGGKDNITIAVASQDFKFENVYSFTPLVIKNEAIDGLNKSALKKAEIGSIAEQAKQEVIIPKILRKDTIVQKKKENANKNKIFSINKTFVYIFCAALLTTFGIIAFVINNKNVETKDHLHGLTDDDLTPSKQVPLITESVVKPLVANDTISGGNEGNNYMLRLDVYTDKGMANKDSSNWQIKFGNTKFAINKNKNGLYELLAMDFQSKKSAIDFKEKNVLKDAIIIYSSDLK